MVVVVVGGRGGVAAAALREALHLTWDARLVHALESAP